MKVERAKAGKRIAVDKDLATAMGPPTSRNWVRACAQLTTPPT